MFTPSALVGTMKVERRWYGGASGSVTAITIRNDEKCALDENHFSPLIAQLSPRSSARVAKTLGSAPPCGSVIEKHDTISLLRSGSRYCFFCSVVPYLARIS